MVILIGSWIQNAYRNNSNNFISHESLAADSLENMKLRVLQNRWWWSNLCCVGGCKAASFAEPYLIMCSVTKKRKPIHDTVTTFFSKIKGENMGGWHIFTETIKKQWTMKYVCRNDPNGLGGCTEHTEEDWTYFGTQIRALGLNHVSVIKYLPSIFVYNQLYQFHILTFYVSFGGILGRDRVSP